MENKGMFDLSGRVALITGGGHGIGRAYCEAMAEFGADVAVNDINIELARETVDLIKKFGHKAIPVQSDVTKPDEVERMIQQIVAEFDTIDILLNTVGIGSFPCKLHEVSVQDWERAIAVNLTSAFLCMREVLPIMMQKKRGSIIITSSVAGMVAGGASAPQYGAAKAGLIGLTKHAAMGYAKEGIRINAIVPGGHETWPVNVPREEYAKLNEMMVRLVPMGRIAKPSEIKGLAVYLASDASCYVTGQTFVQDGGLTA